MLTLPHIICASFVFFSLSASALGESDLQSCSLPATAEVSFSSMSADISDLRGVRSACVLALAQLAALSPSVVRVGVTARPRLANYEARGVTQVSREGRKDVEGVGRAWGAFWIDAWLDELLLDFIIMSHHTTQSLCNCNLDVHELESLTAVDNLECGCSNCPNA